MGDYLLNDKAELAFVSILKAPVQAAGFDPACVVTGKAYNQKVLPTVVCDASGEGEEDPKGTGNFWLDVTVTIESPAYLLDPASQTDPKVSNESLIAAVFGVLQVDNLDALLSAAIINFYVFTTAFVVGSPQRSQDETGIWKDFMRFRIYCCGTDLT